MLPRFQNPFDAKALWRARLTPLREDAAKARPDAGRHAARAFFDAIDPGSDDIVAIYHSMRSELDTGPLADALAERSIRIALPVVETKKAPLVFRRYAPGDALETGAYGERVPPPSADAVRPDIVVTPLLGYSETGDRLGYGGGYYDRTLQALRETGAVIAVGYAYAIQKVDALPVSPLDQRLDWIVTERGAQRCGGD